MSKLACRALGFWLALGWCAALCASAPAVAEQLQTKTPCACAPAQAGKRAGDQIWLVNTRHLGCLPVANALPNYRVHYFAQQAWHSSHAVTFLSYDDPQRPTVFFIHGNRYSSTDAVNSGWQAYYALTRCLPPEQKIRFVIWSWPSEKAGGPLRDVRIKASRTLVEGYYVSRLLTKIRPDVPTGMIGYSYGSRVALGAVHLAAGGQLAGRVVPDARHDEVAMYRIAMLAAGVENDGLLPGARFEMAMSRTDHLLNLYNPWDPALKRYRFVDKFQRPVAMGYTGIYGEWMLGPAAARITECNVGGIIGKTHHEAPYFASERVMSQVRATVLGGYVLESRPALANK